MISQSAHFMLSQYQRLIEISRDLASTLDLDVLLQRIVDAAADLCAGEAASILLYDQNRNQLFFQASTNLDTPLMRGLIVPVNNSISGWIVQNREPMNVEDAQKDPRFFGHVQKETSFHTASLLGVPMIAKEKIIGVLEVLNKRDGPFTRDDQEILMTLGAQAAVAIENARLFQQSDLIAELVHELRTPLASLNAATHLLLRPEVPEDKRSKMVRIIQGETKRLSDLATSFLDLARLESGRTQFKIQEFDPVILLGECVGITRSSMQEHELKLIWQVPEKLPLLMGDRDKIKQVFLNLLSNAIKYNREGGEITLSAQKKPDHLALSFTDTGEGISPENLERLFEKFFRVPGTEKLAQGSGLGLSICQRIVKAHGGNLEVKSQVGAGTTFTLLLPLKVKPRDGLARSS